MGGGSSVAKAAGVHRSDKGYWGLLLSISSMGGRGMLDWGRGDIGKSLPMRFPVPTGFMCCHLLQFLHFALWSSPRAIFIGR